MVQVQTTEVLSRGQTAKQAEEQSQIQNQGAKSEELSVTTIAPLGNILLSLMAGRAPFGYFSLYGPPGQHPTITANYLIADPIRVDDELNEHMPAAAYEACFEFAFSDETLEYVIAFVRTNEPTASGERIVEILDYYSKHDAFPSS